jgi:hypothetical protein
MAMARTLAAAPRWAPVVGSHRKSASAAVTAASSVSAPGTRSAEVIIRLRLSGDSAILPPIRSCLSDKLAQMPDVKVATAPTVGARFIVDLIVAKTAGDNISAALVVAQTFPME